MSRYLDAVAVGDSTQADVGFSLRPKKLLKGVARGVRKVGKVAVLTAVPPLGVAYVAKKAIARRNAKKAKARAQGKRPAARGAAPTTQGGGGFSQDSDDGNYPADDGGGEEAEDEQLEASDDDESSDADSGDDTMSDEIGYDEIGDDVDALLSGDEYVGGPARQRGPNSVQVRSRPNTKAREYPLGFSSSGTIAAAAAATVTAQPQTLFRPKRLVIPSTIAGSFTIQDIKVGNSSQFVASGNIPAALYSELAVGTTQRFDTAAPGILISIAVTNTSGGALAFAAAMVGDSVQ